MASIEIIICDDQCCILGLGKKHYDDEEFEGRAGALAPALLMVSYREE